MSLEQERQHGSCHSQTFQVENVAEFMLQFTSSPLTCTVQHTHACTSTQARAHLRVHLTSSASELTHPCNCFPFTPCLVPYLNFLLEVVFMPGHHYQSHGDRGFHGGETPPAWDAGAVAEAPFPPEGPVQQLTVLSVFSRSLHDGRAVDLDGQLAVCITTGFWPPRTCVLFFTIIQNPFYSQAELKAPSTGWAHESPAYLSNVPSSPSDPVGSMKPSNSQMRREIIFASWALGHTLWSGLAVRPTPLSSGGWLPFLFLLQVWQVFPARTPLVLQRSSDTSAPQPFWAPGQQVQLTYGTSVASINL